MPNWCSNTIEISGDAEDIKKLLQNAKGEKSDFSLDQLVPIPKEEADNWYSWNVANWGTKWDLSDVVVEVNDDNVIVNCQTAWGPPLEGLAKISKDYPNLNFEIVYEESGMDFCGKSYFVNGEGEHDERTWNEQFGISIKLDSEKSLLEDSKISIPLEVTYTSDPYDFESEQQTIKTIMTIPVYDDIDEVDLEAEFNETISFDNPEIDDVIMEKGYELAEEISNNYHEIKTVALNNSLNQKLKTNSPNKKTKKI